MKGKRQRFAPFRFRKVGSGYLITGESGEFAFLAEAHLRDLAAGKIAAQHPAFQALADKGFVGEGASKEKASERYRDKVSSVFAGPCLHIVIPTLRCNQSCPFCQASRKPMSRKGYDMTEEVAARVVDFIFQSPSEDLTVEFQGGEPLANFPLIRFMVEAALQRNRPARRRLSFSIVTNTTLLGPQILDYLISNRFQICTSLDGPGRLHNAQRPFSGGDSHRTTVRWLRLIDRAYEKQGLDPSLYQTEALCTVTRLGLGQPGRIVDEYVRLGRKAIFLRPLNPFGLARAARARLGCSAEQFIEFYLGALEHIIELNRQGKEILERTAAIYLAKMLGRFDPNYLDIRSPCGAGIGQIAYNYDGGIFTCDEGRMLGEMGDEAFQAGQIGQSTLRDVIASEAVTSCAVASCLDIMPLCSDCAYKPYCGTCPVFNYSEQGSIFGRMPENFRCKVSMAVLDYLFGLIRADRENILPIFKQWAVARDRPFFYER